ncbi:hypothetical protein [Nostoc sp.]
MTQYAWVSAKVPISVITLPAVPKVVSRQPYSSSCASSLSHQPVGQ